MKKIPAYLNGVCYETEVDDEDYEFLSQFPRWTAKISNKTVYLRTNVEYLGEWYNIEMHRMVIGDAVDAIEELDTPYREV